METINPDLILRLMVSIFALQMTADLLIYGGICKHHRTKVEAVFLYQSCTRSPCRDAVPFSFLEVAPDSGAHPGSRPAVSYPEESAGSKQQQERLEPSQEEMLVLRQ